MANFAPMRAPISDGHCLAPRPLAKESGGFVKGGGAGDRNTMDTSDWGAWNSGAPTETERSKRGSCSTPTVAPLQQQTDGNSKKLDTRGTPTWVPHASANQAQQLGMSAPTTGPEVSRLVSEAQRNFDSGFAQLSADAAAADEGIVALSNAGGSGGSVGTETRWRQRGAAPMAAPQQRSQSPRRESPRPPPPQRRGGDVQPSLAPAAASSGNGRGGGNGQDRGGGGDFMPRSGAPATRHNGGAAGRASARAAAAAAAVAAASASASDGTRRLASVPPTARPASPLSPPSSSSVGGGMAGSKERKQRPVPRPGVIKGPWTKEEDDIIVSLFNSGVKKWAEIAEQIPGRVGKQCRERWFNHLDPSVKKTVWLPEEDRVLVTAQQSFGNSWTKIAKLLPGRSENAVKNRWNSAARRKAKAEVDGMRAGAAAGGDGSGFGGSGGSGGAAGRHQRVAGSGGGSGSMEDDSAAERVVAAALLQEKEEEEETLQVMHRARAKSVRGRAAAQATLAAAAAAAEAAENGGDARRRVARSGSPTRQVTSGAMDPSAYSNMAGLWGTVPRSGRPATAPTTAAPPPLSYFYKYEPALAVRMGESRQQRRHYGGSVPIMAAPVATVPPGSPIAPRPLHIGPDGAVSFSPTRSGGGAGARSRRYDGGGGAMGYDVMGGPISFAADPTDSLNESMLGMGLSTDGAGLPPTLMDEMDAPSRSLPPPPGPPSRLLWPRQGTRFATPAVVGNGADGTDLLAHKLERPASAPSGFEGRRQYSDDPRHQPFLMETPPAFSGRGCGGHVASSARVSESIGENGGESGGESDDDCDAEDDICEPSIGIIGGGDLLRPMRAPVEAEETHYTLNLSMDFSGLGGGALGASVGGGAGAGSLGVLNAFHDSMGGENFLLFDSREGRTVGEIGATSLGTALAFGGPPRLDGSFH
ncbi:unnamed protein product [Phaeothamnion confervicola]